MALLANCRIPQFTKFVVFQACGQLFSTINFSVVAAFQSQPREPLPINVSLLQLFVFSVYLWLWHFENFEFEKCIKDIQILFLRFIRVFLHCRHENHSFCRLLAEVKEKIEHSV